jgi:hypothetical protein
MAFPATAGQRKLKLSLLILAALAVTVLSVGAASAQADFSLVPNSFVADAYKADGVTPETQAGAAPYQTSVEFGFNTLPGLNQIWGTLDPDGDVKDIEVNLPAGLIGDPQAVPRCPRTAFVQPAPVPCPLATQVGVLHARLSAASGGSTFDDATFPVFNVVPRGDDVADFAFSLLGATVHIVANVRSDGDFGVQASLKNISSAFPVISSKLTLWGVPADPSHDPERGLFCTTANGCIFGPGNNPSGLEPRAFLRNPTFCGPPVTTTFQADSWQNPGQFISAASTTASGPTGCGNLAFDPSITTTLDTSTASSPAGLSVDLTVPQPTDPNTLATPHLKKAVVKLPVGVTLSPSAADGLQGCSDTQIALHSNAEPTCPSASKIGDVRLETPVLPDALTGPIYLGTQTPSQLVRLFLVMRGPGLLVKLGGRVDLDPVTGQLTATFDDNPQLPFSDLKLNFKSGPRAALTTPSSCGTYTTETSLTPWSGDDQTAHPTSSFVIDKGCGNEGTFAPSFDAGVVKPRAGGSSPFTLTFDRTDRDQAFSRIDTVLPPGLLAKVGSVPLCGDAQAGRDACPAESLIGKTTVGAGPGTNPFFLGGRVYLTGPYKGSNYGLSIVVPAVAGPFDLGTVTVRAGMWIDPHDAHVTVKSDPLPTILDGIPLQVRKVNVLLDRSDFMVNPTNCDAMKITGDITSTKGKVAPVSSTFQATDCAALPFSPTFKPVTSGKASRQNGAGLHVHIAQDPGEAAMKSVAVTLPRKLPARLVPTINGACPFEVERDQGYTACPQTSRVGWATAVTPLLSEPVEGPAYIVAKGDALPKLSLYLAGPNNIRLQLDGDIDINPKTNLTKTTFAMIPDVPITSFDLDLPKGAHSALAAPGNDLCQGSMKMITTIIAQSGKRIDRKVPVKVTGCGTRVASKTVGASSVRLQLERVGAGRITAWGAHLRTTKQTLTDGTTASITVPLSAEGRRSLARRGTLKVKVLVSYAPAKGQPQSSTKSRHTATSVTFTQNEGR